jgi:hypothetical protein
VNLGKIGKKLQREAATNPKKAVFLGVAAVVALYFWTPLVWGWIGKSDPNMTTATVTTAVAPLAATAMPSASSFTDVTKSASAPRPSWSQLVELKHNDPRTMTAPPLTHARDPFESPKQEIADTNAAEDVKPKLRAITPVAAGLVLTSTIIGPQRRVAQISGRTYTVGQSIEASKGKETLGVAFKLVEIRPRQAVLEANGQRFELSIPEPGKSGKIEFAGAVGSGQ